MQTYRAGIDIGSTTVKLAVLDESDNLIYGEYSRHNAHTQDTLKSLLIKAREVLGECLLRVKITGSGSINLSKAMDIGFVQEVVAVATALKRTAPETDVAIELGGEDAKIIYFAGGLDERMNGVCAGGTGSFIDQMASLLQTDAEHLNLEAREYKSIYPIAARCGVFAKTDIQPLINEGATRADLAASIFQAVVNQTISGLACGKPIRGNVAFLGGPLHFLTELKAAFIRTLRLTPETTVSLDNSHLFAAMGSALEADGAPAVMLSSLIERLEGGIEIKFEMPRLAPLFWGSKAYEDFKERHDRAKVAKRNIKEWHGNCFLGIDAGSTTTKLALISDRGELLFSFYANNRGNPIETAKSAIAELAKLMPEDAKICRATSTGYGEALLKSAFRLDSGEVETIAHCTAASFFEPNVDCVLDIGGQDMKCIKLKNGAVDTILLNEACSSGCGSFIENFANSLGYTAEEFAGEALFARSPVDLGTRCTVFMNSNVKQAQKEGAAVSDISAGLAYSVIKNALYKVIKLSKGSELGSHIVVQGGTFHNRAVLRAFEAVTGVEAICPDIAGLMGAFGAALIARNEYNGIESTMLSFKEIAELTYTAKSTRCQGCSNSCMLTVNTFSNGSRHITGNRCEKGLGKAASASSAENLVQYKRERIFSYPALDIARSSRGVIGMPRVLNIYENYPFWATFFYELGFSLVLSPFSSRRIYELGMDSIPSESECYPAKLAHGHVQYLINEGIKTIFHPCVFYEKKERPEAKNHFNCPIVISYPENLKNNVESVSEGEVRYIRPFIAFTDIDTVTERLVDVAYTEWNIPEAEVRTAVRHAWRELEEVRRDIRQEGRRVLDSMRARGASGIVLAGRPYHIDPEINHGIPELIASYGLNVFTEDSLPTPSDNSCGLRVVDQWTFHSRLYSAARYVAHCDDLELVQLNSFGCGLDAVTSDQVNEILDNSGKLYTLIKIDEVNNLGAVTIRIRSLISAMERRRKEGIKSLKRPYDYKRVEYTRQMKKDGYTILAPQMSPIHFEIVQPVFNKHGYNAVLLNNDNRSAIDTGLKYVNNDACFPSMTVIGQIMEAVLSGKYDTDRLAILMTQTGGCCRASNYVPFIRRALKKAGLEHIPVISLNTNGMEKNSGFKVSPFMLLDAARAIVYGDLIMRCLYRTRPYEKTPGSAEALHKKWRDACIAYFEGKGKQGYKAICNGIVRDFDALELNDTVKPRVGIVGEILVKYMPLANNRLVEVLESEGAEVIVPDMLDFFNYSFYNNQYRRKFLGLSKRADIISKLAVQLIRYIRRPAVAALEGSKRFSTPVAIEKIAEMTKPFLSIGNQYGEGWFLTGEMVELLTHETDNIVCIQPFGCLPNHVVGKGVIKALKKVYPNANIAAVDYDPGASEVNQLNRIKLMLSEANRRLKP